METILVLLMSLIPLAIIYEREIRVEIYKIVKKFKEEEPIKGKEYFKRIDRVHEVEEVQALESFDNREVIKVNDSYQTVVKNTVSEGDLVYIGEGKGIRCIKKVNEPEIVDDVELVGNYLYEPSFASGYRQIAKLEDPDIRGRYKFAK